MGEEGVVGIASFNQAGYSQIRLHELFLRVDRLSINPLIFSQEFGCYHYEIIFRDLCSVFSTISSKLNDKELEEAIKIKKELSKALKSTPAFKSNGFRDLYGKTKQNVSFNDENWEGINENLFLFRLILEKQMDRHGFGNPSRKEVNKAAIT